MKRVLFAALMLTLATGSLAQGEESRSYECIVKISSGASFDKNALEWGPMRYNLRGYKYWVSLYEERKDIYRVRAGPFGELGEYCLDTRNIDMDIESHGKDVIKCGIVGKMDAQTWRFNLRTLRFMVVYSDGYLDGGTSGVPRIELGQCLKM